MKRLYRRCAGIDVHKKSISVYWLKERKVRQVAMESTGVYWIPVWNILERKKWRLELDGRPDEHFRWTLIHEEAAKS